MDDPILEKRLKNMFESRAGELPDESVRKARIRRNVYEKIEREGNYMKKGFMKKAVAAVAAICVFGSMTAFAIGKIAGITSRTDIRDEVHTYEQALELLPVSKDTPQPEGGRIGLDENGELDGRFYDNAMDPLYESIQAPDREELKEMMLEACKELNRYGVTSSQTDDYCVYRSIPYSEVNEAYKELEAEGKLTVRVYEQCNFTEPEQLQQFLADGNMTGKGTDHFKIGPLKLLGDGALGGRTAYLSKGYADDPDNHGFPLFSKETMQALVSCANAAGMQIATHAIGDACLDMVLDCYENALKEHPRTDHRHGIVHCQASRADQLERIEKMNLHVYAQSIFLDYDNHIVEQRLGKELASTSYNWKTLKDHGVSVSNGTDCPVELPDVLGGIQCAVTRKTLKDQIGPYLPDQAFTVQEAIDSFTTRSAEGSFEEVRGIRR